MSAARRKGKWVGGTPVLGYDVGPGGGRLVVNEKESHRVGEIFKLFLQHRSLSAVIAELALRRWKTKFLEVTKGNGTRRPSLHQGVPAKAAHQRHLHRQGRAPRLDLSRRAAGNHRDQRVGTGQRRAECRPPQSQCSAHEAERAAGRAAFLHRLQPAHDSHLHGQARAALSLLRVSGGPPEGMELLPAKSLPARRIEDSVIAQLRVALRPDETHEQLNISDADWQGFEQADPGRLVRGVVQKIGYNGATGAVSLKLDISETQT